MTLAHLMGNDRHRLYIQHHHHLSFCTILSLQQCDLERLLCYKHSITPPAAAGSRQSTALSLCFLAGCRLCFFLHAIYIGQLKLNIYFHLCIFCPNLVYSKLELLSYRQQFIKAERVARLLLLIYHGKGNSGRGRGKKLMEK